MAQKLVINANEVADLLEGYGAGALIRIERSLLPTSGFTEILTETLVDGVEQYELWDPSGGSSHYYKTRYSSISGGLSSEYSAVFRAGTLRSYATIDSLIETMDLPDERRYNLLSESLVRATDRLTAMCGRSFFRDPQVAGDDTWTLTPRNRYARTLSEAIHRGIDLVSLTTLELADGTAETYNVVALGSTGYYLVEGNGTTDPPYIDVMLSDVGSAYTYFPAGHAVIRLTGVRGYETVPPLIEQATIDLAREWYRQGPGGGGPVGINQFGTPVFGQGTPSSVRDAFEAYRLQSFVYV